MDFDDRARKVSERPIAYVMEQTLGNITHYLNIRRAEALSGAGTVRWLPIEFQSSVLPWTVTGSWLSRRALQPVLNEVDGVFIHTMTLMLGSLDLFARKPIILSCDATPIAKRDMRAAYGLRQRLVLTELTKREVYRQVFKRAAGFVAWSQWAKDSLVKDYGCPEADVAVVSPGIDLELFTPGTRDHALPRILFVGGDFVRKGGDLLLAVFREHLRGKAELVLVTRDDVPNEPGVVVYKNLGANSDKLRELYATSDIFALPTRADCYGLSCMEAMAAGLPVVTTRMGGIPDIVDEGSNGYVIVVDDSRALTSALLSFVMEPEKRRTMGEAARAWALERFDANANAKTLFNFVRSRC